jgi:hypothetical protein
MVITAILVYLGSDGVAFPANSDYLVLKSTSASQIQQNEKQKAMLTEIKGDEESQQQTFGMVMVCNFFKSAKFSMCSCLLAACKSISALGPASTTSPMLTAWRLMGEVLLLFTHFKMAAFS